MRRDGVREWVVRNFIPVALAAFSPSLWARYEDLWGDDEGLSPERFSSETTAFLAVAAGMAVLVLYCWDKGGWRRWLPVAAMLAAVPVWLFAPDWLALYVFAPFVYYFLIWPFVRNR